MPTSAPPGPALSRNSSDVPKAIPDNGTVTSTLQIAEQARIVDLNARILQITHTFVSDLVIEAGWPRRDHGYAR